MFTSTQEDASYEELQALMAKKSASSWKARITSIDVKMDALLHQQENRSHGGGGGGGGGGYGGGGGGGGGGSQAELMRRASAHKAARMSIGDGLGGDGPAKVQFTVQ
jgi:hypothetical protein